jgi:hypothetical protein
MTTRLHITAALACLLAAPLARAESPTAETANSGFAPTADAAGAFGTVGQLALSLGATSGEYLSYNKSGGGWTFRLAPAADYFLFPHISLGGLVAYGHGSGGGGTGTTGVSSDSFDIGARAGYALAINDRFGLWPLVGLRLDYISAGHASQTDTFLPIYVPFLFHPAEHFFVGAGPRFDVHLSGHDNTVWGLDTVLGGWLPL